MGFPGNLEVEVGFSIAPGPVLRIDVRATGDAETLCNFAHHSYVNLSGRPTIAGHRLRVAADSYLPVDDDLIPTGERRPVTGTPFDLRRGVTLMQGGPAGGFDHNFCLSDARGPIRPVAWLTAPDGGLTLTVTGAPISDNPATRNTALVIGMRLLRPAMSFSLTEPRT